MGEFVVFAIISLGVLFLLQLALSERPEERRPIPPWEDVRVWYAEREAEDRRYLALYEAGRPAREAVIEAERQAHAHDFSVGAGRCSRCGTSEIAHEAMSGPGTMGVRCVAVAGKGAGNG